MVNMTYDFLSQASHQWCGLLQAWQSGDIYFGDTRIHNYWEERVKESRGEGHLNVHHCGIKSIELMMHFCVIYNH